MKKIAHNIRFIAGICLVALFLYPAVLSAQEDTTLVEVEVVEQEEESGPDNRPVRQAFESHYLIDGQTYLIIPKGSKEFVIHHRFSPVDNGITDIFGIYGPSNIRLGLNYSILDNLMVGIGTTKDKKYQDLHWKWNPLVQTRSGSIPFGVSYYGNLALNASNESNFGPDYKFSNRLSYFTQIIIWRKFTEALTLQIAPSFSHFNKVWDNEEHDKIGISFGGRLKLSTQQSILVNYDQPLHIEGIAEHIPLQYKPKPNLGIGWELSTSTHVFQIVASSGKGIIPQDNMMFNNYDFTTKEGWLIGFNITRIW